MHSIGLFCGTFNPIHNGHLLIAECAADQFALEKVLFVTSAKPPHRNTGLLPSELRHRLVESAVKDNPHFQSSRLELDRSGPSYTIDTVDQIKALYGTEVEISLIVGGDNLKTIRDWHRAEHLIESCRFLVAPRLVYDNAVVTHEANDQEAAIVETVRHPDPAQRYDLPGGKVQIIDFPASSISSSTIRKRMCERKSIMYMVPKAVNEILLENLHLFEPGKG